MDILRRNTGVALGAYKLTFESRHLSSCHGNMSSHFLDLVSVSEAARRSEGHDKGGQPTQPGVVRSKAHVNQRLEISREKHLPQEGTVQKSCCLVPREAPC